MNNYSETKQNKNSNVTTDNDGFILVSSKKREPRTQKYQRGFKYDTRSTCPSDTCKDFSEGTNPVMVFVEKVSNECVRVQCKWCSLKYLIALKVLPRNFSLKHSENEVKSVREPRPRTNEKKQEKLDTRNLFDVLADDQ